MTNQNQKQSAQDIKIPWRNRILTRTLVLLLIISLIPILLIGGAAGYFVGKDAKKKAEDSLVTTVSDITNLIDNYIIDLTKDMEFIASHIDQKDVFSKDNIRLLSAFTSSHRDIQTIWVTDNEGKDRVLFSHDRMITAADFEVDTQSPVSHPRDKGLVWHGTKRNMFGEYLVIASIFIMAPWQTQSAGVMFFEIRLEDIQNILKRIGVGKTGYAFVVNKSGQLIGHTDRSLVLAGTDMTFHPEVKLMLDDRSRDFKPHLSPHKDVSGKALLSAYQRVTPLRWGVVVEQKKSEVYQMRNRLIWLTTGIFTALILLVVPLAILFSLKLTHPIKKLFETTRKLTGGNRDARAEIAKNDEVGAFAKMFNQLIEFHQKSERIIVEEREFSNSLISSMQDGFSVLDSSSVRILVNNAFCQMTGFSREELIGVGPPQPYWPPEEYEEIERTFQKTLQGEFDNFELTFMRKNGERFPVIISPSWIKDKNGNIISYITTVKDITERKQAELELQKREQLLSSILDNVSIHIWDFDGEEYSYLSKSYCEYTGIDSSLPLTIESWTECVHPDDLPTAVKIWQEAWEGKKEHDNYFRLKSTSGEFRDFWCHAIPIFDKGGQFSYFQGFNVDITERKKAEEALRESEANYRELVENTNCIILKYDNNNKITFFNEYAQEFFGYHKDEILGKNVMIIVPEKESTGRVLKTLPKDILESPEDYTENINENIRKNGESVWISWRNQASRDSKGNVIGNLAVGQDITERTWMEKELQETQKELDIIFNSVPAMIWSKNSEGKYLRVNKTYCEAVGLSKEKILDRTDYDLYPTDIADQYSKYDQEVINYRKPVSGIEESHLKPSGDYGWSLTEKLPYYDAEGAVVGTIGFALDITERKQAEEQLKKYAAALEKARNTLEQKVQERTQELKEAHNALIRKEKLAVLGQLSSGVAHELRNPLGVIKNACYFLNMKIKTIEDEAVKDNIKIMSREISTADRIITDLLDFARIREPIRQATDINQLITQTLSKSLIPENITVSTDLPEGMASIAIDPIQTSQIFLNLIENAVHAMGKGGNLKIATKVKNGITEIIFTDEGHGIPKENLSKIFEPLFTTKAKGIGLGLSVSNSLAKANGADILVESEEGKGSRFVVRFGEWSSG